MTSSSATRKIAEPDQIAQALALREAGFSTLSISQRTGIPTRTLERHFQAAGARKGSLKEEMLSEARKELLGLVSSSEAIREEAAKLVADDLAHARYLRQIMQEAAEHMQATNLQEAALVMRAAAAYATAIKATSDVLKHALHTESQEDREELPELVITDLTAEEIEELQGNNGASAMYQDAAKDAVMDDADNEVIELTD